jgi:5-methylthioadenosine/S-adenosylhomocysteine deaminase
MVYSADSSVIDTVICGGRVLMQNRRVPGEEEIIERARKVCRKIAQ